MNCCTEVCINDGYLHPDDDYSLSRRFSSPVLVEADYISETCPIDQILGSSRAGDRDLPVATLSPKRNIRKVAFSDDDASTIPLTPLASAWKRVSNDSEIKSFRKEIYNSACKMATDIKEEIIDIADDVASGTAAIAVEINDMMNQNLMNKKMMIAEQNENNNSPEMVKILDALSAKYDSDLGKVLRKSKKIVTEKVIMTISQENLLYLTIVMGVLLLCFCKILLAFKMVSSFQTSLPSTQNLAQSQVDHDTKFFNHVLATFSGVNYNYHRGEFQTMQPFFDEETVTKVLFGIRKFAAENFVISRKDLESVIDYL